MVQRGRPAERSTLVTVRVVFEPSRIASACLARAYAVAVPLARRREPTVVVRGVTEAWGQEEVAQDGGSG